MTLLTLHQVMDSTGAALARGHGATVVEGVSTDTRTVRGGELYFALSGPNHDGNAFATEAVRKGAGALLLRAREDAPASRLLAELGLEGSDVPVLVHRDPRRALGDLAAWHRSRLEVPVIGITGSCGKTTVKDILAQLLGHGRKVVASPRSYNNDVGVPLTLLAAPLDADALIVEVGTNQPGEIAALCRIVRPTAGIVTNIGSAHLAGLGSLEGVAREKADLAAACPADGFVVLNADCRFTPMVASVASAPSITFSIEGGGSGEGASGGEGAGDLDARDVHFHSGGTTFRLDGREVTSPLLGLHNVQNLLAALAACRGLGLSLDDVLPHVSQLRGGRQRMERHELGGVTVFDDSWNANPDSARAAVRVLAGLHGFRRRVLVLGDMLELGAFAAEAHKRIGCETAEAGIDLLIPVGELGRATAAGALECGQADEGVVHLESTALAVERVPELVRDGDVVLVKGSRSMACERIVHGLLERYGHDASREARPKVNGI